MRTLVATLFALGVVVAQLALASEASAFCRSTTCRSTAAQDCETDENTCMVTGSKLFWPTRCVSFALNDQGTQDLDPDDTFNTIRKTFAAWAEVPCAGGGMASITFQERGPISCKKSEYKKDGPNVNVILFQDNDWKYRGIDGTLAKTSVTYNDDTGEIYDADIEVNASANALSLTSPPQKVEYDLQAILTHEVGHFIGIGHSGDDNAVMAPTYPPGSIAQRTLTADDIAAVCAIYPPSSSASCNPEPRGGYSDICDTTETKGQCAASPAPVETGHGTVIGTSLGVVGVGLLALMRRARQRRLA